MSAVIKDHARYREILKNLRSISKGIQISWGMVLVIVVWNQSGLTRII